MLAKKQARKQRKRKDGIQETEASTQECGKRKVSDVSHETRGCTVWRGSLASHSITQELKKKKKLKEMVKTHYSSVSKKAKTKATRNPREQKLDKKDLPKHDKNNKEV